MIALCGKDGGGGRGAEGKEWLTRVSDRGKQTCAASDKEVRQRMRGKKEGNKRRSTKREEKLGVWLNIHQGCVVMGSDVEQPGRRRRQTREANNERREKHPHALRHSWRHTGSRGSDTNSQIQMCNYGEANTRGRTRTPSRSFPACKNCD